MRRTPLIPVAIAATALLATALPAQAHEPDVVADSLVSPLSLAVAADGTVYVAQNFASLITKVAPGAEPETIFADEGGREVGAFSLDGDVLTYGVSIPGQDVTMWTYTPVEGGGYQPEQIADLWAYEKSHNPDKGNTYGITGLSKSCKKQAKGFLPYKGDKDSHAYASTTLDGITYVADAGANAILAIDGGVVSTVAVLPPTKVKITKGVRKALDAPKCTLGKTIRLQPVPTDVEVDPDGHLLVTSLPGGPEDSAMGANGAIYSVNQMTGEVVRVVTGLSGPTGLAIAPDGTTYVAMLYADTVLQVSPQGEKSTFEHVTQPGDIEYADGSLYVTESHVFEPPGPPNGRVLKFALDG